MDILGIGTDIVECPRIGKMIEQHGEIFLRRIYTDREIRYGQARKHALEHFRPSEFFGPMSLKRGRDFSLRVIILRKRAGNAGDSHFVFGTLSEQIWC